MKKRKQILILGSLCLCVLLGSGCGNQIPEMDAAQENKVTQFATDILLPKTRSRLVDTEKEGILRAEKARKDAEIQLKIKNMKQAEAAAEAEKKEEGSDASVENLAGESPAPATVMHSVGEIASFLGMDGFEITYDGFEITDEYVDNIGDSGDWMPTVTASKGYHLLVVKLGVINRTEEAKVADVINTRASFRISAETDGAKNGGSSLMTMLLSDFTILKEELAPGEAREYVVITQVPSSVSYADSISLVIKRDGESFHVGLQ